MKALLISLLAVIVLAGCSWFEDTTVTVTESTVAPTVGELPLSIVIDVHYEVISAELLGFELFIDQACTIPLISPLIITAPILQGSAHSFVFYAKNIGDAEMTLASAAMPASGDTYLVVAPAQAPFSVGSVIEYTLYINATSPTTPGQYSGTFTITAS